MSLDPQQAQLAFPVAAQVFGALVTAHTKDGRGRVTPHAAGKMAEKAIVAAFAFGGKWAEYLEKGGRPPWAASGSPAEAPGV